MAGTPGPDMAELSIRQWVPCLLPPHPQPPWGPRRQFRATGLCPTLVLHQTSRVTLGKPPLHREGTATYAPEPDPHRTPHAPRVSPPLARQDTVLRWGLWDQWEQGQLGLVNLEQALEAVSAVANLTKGPQAGLPLAGLHAPKVPQGTRRIRVALAGLRPRGQEGLPKGSRGRR